MQGVVAIWAPNIAACLLSVFMTAIKLYIGTARGIQPADGFTGLIDLVQRAAATNATVKLHSVHHEGWLCMHVDRDEPCQQVCASIFAAEGEASAVQICGLSEGEVGFKLPDGRWMQVQLLLHAITSPLRHSRCCQHAAALILMSSGAPTTPRD